ncbi:MAG TPA: pyridoxine 5'-phosphate synthase [Verrucomicrobiales bacterium]|nr:pyridoxine 5'-phosphate synthase [Verrucomicrobiales bacterium]
MGLKLGVNIDHVATLRQARYALMPDWPGSEPALLEAAQAALRGGADSITIHLREDRRHIQDRDVEEIREGVTCPLNLEMGNTEEILEIALRWKPDFVCLVPENRAEVTTEGGLDVAGQAEELRPAVARLRERGILVSLFIDPEIEQVRVSREIGGDMVELHTGAYAQAAAASQETEISRLRGAAIEAQAAGLQVNAGHGITMQNVRGLFSVPHLVEFNIGHHLVSRALFIGLEQAVREMIEAMREYSGS